ncbi:unnamed protein product [Amoebophrya sp. A120]|nr:unnamed protein product [Amoebophrya sp. A120]|eukprot:GSA120T00023268001.1
MIKAKLPVNHQCVDFGVCANVLLSPEKNVQVGILETIHKCLKPKGVLFLLVPALESHLFGLWAVQHGPGKECSQLVKGIDKYNAKMSRQDLLNGIVKRGDQEVRTQHYIKEQIIEMVNSVGFDVLHTTKAEFTWDTEIDFDCISNNTSQAAVEKKFKKLNSGPFDWILVLRKE